MRKYFIAAIVSLFAGLTLLAPTSPARAADARDCAAYVYFGSHTSVCDRLGDATDVNCDQVAYRVSLVGVAVDPWSLDVGGKDGVGCQSYPVRHFPPTVKPKPSASPSSSKPTVKPRPSASASHTPGAGVHTIPNPPQNGPALAVTGPDGRVLAGGAAVLALLGGALLVVSRRRKTHFRA